MKKIIVAQIIWPSLQRKREILNRSQFRIFIAPSNEEALAIHRTEDVDLIITGLHMPGMGGDELCSAIREDKELQDVSVILLCSASEKDIKRVKRCGANEYLTIPVESEDLLAKTVRLLNIPVRKHFRVLASASVEGTSGGETFFCTLVNISVSGMLIETEQMLAMGDTITCSFFLPGSGRITLQGSVVRATDGKGGRQECGLRFDNPSPASQSVIEAFVTRIRSAG